MDNIVNKTFADIEKFGYTLLGYNVWNVHFPDLNNLLFRKLVIWMIVARSKSMPAALNHIRSILLLCSSVKMPWVAAGWIVAFMKNEMAVFYRSVCEEICNPMRHYTIMLMRSISKSSISVIGFLANPIPALIRSCHINFGPKPIKLKWGFADHGECIKQLTVVNYDPI